METFEDMQTYEEYLETMKAYGFIPKIKDYGRWQKWQISYFGFYKNNTDIDQYFSTISGIDTLYNPKLENFKAWQVCRHSEMVRLIEQLVIARTSAIENSK